MSLPHFPTHAYVPHLDAQFEGAQFAADGLDPVAYHVVGMSQTPEGATYVQVWTGSGYLWVKPGEWSEAAA